MTPPTNPSEWFDFGEAEIEDNGVDDPFLDYGGKDAKLRVIRPIRAKKQALTPNVYYAFPCIRGDESEQTVSPFRLGPCCLFGNTTSKSLENAWQYSKVYPQHVGSDGQPTKEYFEWAKEGFAAWKAEKYPMGENAIESFFWWNGQKLDDVEARKQIFVPLYVELAVKVPYFQELKKVWLDTIKPDPEGCLYLMDCEAYEYMTLSAVLNNPAKGMAHGYVLAMMLTDDPALKECKLRS